MERINNEIVNSLVEKLIDDDTAVQRRESS
jgi:hypothetical protein